MNCVPPRCCTTAAGPLRVAVPTRPTKSKLLPSLPPVQHEQVHRAPDVVLLHSLLLPPLHGRHLLVYHHKHLNTIHDYLQPSPEVLSPAVATTSRSYLQVIQPSPPLPSLHCLCRTLHALTKPWPDPWSLSPCRRPPYQCLDPTRSVALYCPVPCPLLALCVRAGVLGREGGVCLAYHAWTMTKRSQRSGISPVNFGSPTNSMFSVVLS